MRPIPAAEPLPGSQLNTTVQDTLNALRTQAQNRLQAKLNAHQQAAQGRIHIAQGIAGADASHWQPDNHWQPSPTPVYELSQAAENPAAHQAFRNFINPAASGQAVLPIQEDTSWIQANLAHASRPVSIQEQLLAAQNATLMRQQLEAQQTYYQEQAELAQAQRQALQLQARVKHNAERAAYMPLTNGLPSLKYRGFDFTRIITEGKILPDELLNQFFHLLELNEHIDPTNKKASSFLVEKLAKNMSIGPHALRNKDGYVIIGNQAYGQSEALAKARKDLEYFHQHGKHMPPLNYPTIPPENIDPRRHREVYPDVTKHVQKILDQIKSEIKTAPKGFFKGTKPLFEKNFPNNGKWDLQVGYGLPGQVVLRDPQTKEPLQDVEFPDKVATTDQYAFFRGKARRAGYISNFAYGYGAAAAGLDLIFAQWAPQIKGEKLDNREDQKAIEAGYQAYRKEEL